MVLQFLCSIYHIELFIMVFTKACGLTVLLGCFDLFQLIWFCKYQAFVFSSIAITNLLASKGVSALTIIPKSTVSFL